MGDELLGLSGRGHERLLQRGALRRQLVQDDALPVSQFADGRRVCTGDDEGSVRKRLDLGAFAAQGLGEGVGGGCADQDRGLGELLDEIVDRAVVDHLAEADDDQLVGHQ